MRLAALAEHILALEGCNRIYADVAMHQDPREFVDAALASMNVEVRHIDDTPLHLPAKGPCVVVANHPFGAVEGLILISQLLRSRPDMRIMANYLLTRIPQLQPLIIAVDPFERHSSVRSNIRPLREAIQWLKEGGVLAVFPAGEVAHLTIKRREITDPAWNPTVAKIIHKTRTPVLPVYFKGANPSYFQALGLLHPRLRTALLARQLVNKQGTTIQLRAGSLLPYHWLERFSSDAGLIDYLRWRTYLLGDSLIRDHKMIKIPMPGRKIAKVPIAPPVQADLLRKEIEALPPDQKLVSSGDNTVFFAQADQIRHLLREIGRLRELSFRQAHEGTGKAADIDGFDLHYLHLFIWNSKHDEVVGAYRIGQCDTILDQFGLSGLYTSTLFKLRQAFFDAIGPALELGRSFIRPDYQKSYAPLLLLWKGIARYIVQNPRYRILFGPVSISKDYSNLARQLIASTLLRHRQARDLALMVRPRRPLRLKRIRVRGCKTMSPQIVGSNLDEFSSIIGDIEFKNGGVPVLLRHYLNLGGQLLGFNIDKDFSDVVDGLVLVDLMETDFRTLKRFMGKNDAQAFVNFHQKTSLAV